MKHDRLTDELRERVAGHVLGGLEVAEARAFDRHLADDGCEPCCREVGRLRSVVEALGHAAPPVAPPAGLRARVMSAMEDEPGEHAGGPGAPSTMADIMQAAVIVRDDDTGWQNLGEGAEVKVLHADAGGGRRTAIVRLAAGASIAPHRHADVEEVFILAGDCHVAPGVVLGPGDYFRAEAGSTHEYTYSERGTTLFLVSRNEILTAD